MRRTALIALAFLLSAAPAAADSERHRGHRDRESRYGHHDGRHRYDDRVERLAHRIERSAHDLYREARHRVGRVDRREAAALAALRDFRAETRRFRVHATRHHRASRARIHRLERALRHAESCFDDLRAGRRLRGDFVRVGRLVDDLEVAYASAHRPAPRHHTHRAYRHGYRDGHHASAPRGPLAFWLRYAWGW